jgi:hypothetical protein
VKATIAPNLQRMFFRRSSGLRDTGLAAQQAFSILAAFVFGYREAPFAGLRLTR